MKKNIQEAVKVILEGRINEAEQPETFVENLKNSLDSTLSCKKKITELVREFKTFQKKIAPTTKQYYAQVLETLNQHMKIVETTTKKAIKDSKFLMG